MSAELAAFDDRVPRLMNTERSNDDFQTDPVELHADQSELEYESYADTSMTIPGQGEPGENCGIWGPMQFCDNCGEPRFGQERCDQRTCPDCAGRWEQERTVGAVQRLAKGRYAEADGIDRRTMHAVASPPTGEIMTLKDWYDGYREAYRLAEEAGIRGGVVVGHGYRINEDTKKEYREKGIEGGIWNWIVDELPGSWRDYTYWSPHYHIIGLCRELAENKPSEQDGWQMVRLDSLAPFESTTDKDGANDMIRRFRYILNHGTFESGTTKDCVRWFGSLSTAKFSPEAELSEGANSAIDRLVEELVGNPENSGDAADPELEEEDCCEVCGGTSFSTIFDAGYALMDRSWTEQIGREQQNRLEVAFQWAIGEIEPPPELIEPRSEEEAHEAFESLL